MPQVSLRPGEDNISQRRVTDDPRGGMRLQWDVCLLDGRVLHKVTRGKNMSKGEVKARARRTAAEALRTSGTTGAWRGTSPISDYIRQECEPAVVSSSLRESSKRRYLLDLNLLADALSGYSIAGGCRPKTIKDALNRIAAGHGTATARQVRKVAGKWVVQRLVLEEVINYNPLRDATIGIDVEYKASTKAAGGVALTEDEYVRVLDYLLACDPADPERTRPRRGHWTQADREAKRRGVIGICLLQATTGLRINEARMLAWDDVVVSGEGVLVTVRPEVSKTHKGRTVQVLDGRVAERMRIRRRDAGDGAALVFGSPCAPGREWERANCGNAVNQFLHGEVAEACGVEKLRDHGSHVWRTTLSTIAMKRGVPDEIRAAAFGHSADVNRNYYTDVTDISEYTRAMMSR